MDQNVSYEQTDMFKPNMSQQLPASHRAPARDFRSRRMQQFISPDVGLKKDQTRSASSTLLQMVREISPSAMDASGRDEAKPASRQN